MDSNTCSCEHNGRPAGAPPDRLAALAADLDGLAAEDLQGLADAALAEQTLQLRQLLHRLEGQWLQHLAAVDARGAAGADHGTRPPPPPAGSATASS